MKGLQLAVALIVTSIVLAWAGTMLHPQDVPWFNGQFTDATLCTNTPTAKGQTATTSDTGSVYVSTALTPGGYIDTRTGLGPC